MLVTWRHKDTHAFHLPACCSQEIYQQFLPMRLHGAGVMSSLVKPNTPLRMSSRPVVGGILDSMSGSCQLLVVCSVVILGCGNVICSQKWLQITIRNQGLPPPRINWPSRNRRKPLKMDVKYDMIWYDVCLSRWEGVSRTRTVTLAFVLLELCPFFQFLIHVL